MPPYKAERNERHGWKRENAQSRFCRRFSIFLYCFILCSILYVYGLAYVAMRLDPKDSFFGKWRERPSKIVALVKHDWDLDCGVPQLEMVTHVGAWLENDSGHFDPTSSKSKLLFGANSEKYSAWSTVDNNKFNEAYFAANQNIGLGVPARCAERHTYSIYGYLDMDEATVRTGAVSLNENGLDMDTTRRMLEADAESFSASDFAKSQEVALFC